MPHAPSPMQHPAFTRRTALQAGAVGLLGLGVHHLAALRAAAATSAGAGARPFRARAAIYIFLSGGLSQLESFDLKPDAPADVRGEFHPVATRTPGVRICEHLPLLAQRSHLWALVRSLTHRTNDHSLGHLFMLTGRSEAPPGFSPNGPKPTDWPAIASVAGAVTPRRNNLPPAVVLPEKLIHREGRVIPGQLAGLMGPRHDPWFIDAARYEPNDYGAYPGYTFDHQDKPGYPKRTEFLCPNLALPQGVGRDQFGRRLDLLRAIDGQRRDLDRLASVEDFDRFHQGAVSLLTDPRVRRAFDVVSAPPRVQDRYGRNSFGWSLLLARQLVEAGVNLAQVNLGNDETWDTHGQMFPHLKNNLFPPADRAISALLDDLHESGLLESTLIVMAGEFGRTPKISTLPQFYRLPGRDHWGAVQTVFFAGGGVRGGTVVGASDKHGGYPAADPQTPENMAATIYRALGVPATAMWQDAEDRPHQVYYGEPIRGVM